MTADCIRMTLPCGDVAGMLTDPNPCKEAPMAEPILVTTTHVINTIACSTPCDSIAVTVPSAVEGQSLLIGKLTPGEAITFWENHGGVQSDPTTITMVDPPTAMGVVTPALSGGTLLVTVVLLLSLMGRRPRRRAGGGG
jgi:hypothetical protein